MYGGVTYATSATSAASAYAAYAGSTTTPSYTTTPQYYSNPAPMQTGVVDASQLANTSYTSPLGNTGTTYTYNQNPTYTPQPQPTQYVGNQYTGQATGSTAYPYNTSATNSYNNAPGFTPTPFAAGLGGNTGLLGMQSPQFVFGVGGPSMENPSSPNRSGQFPQAEGREYLIGDSVELWSVSQNTWLQAKVIGLKPDGTVTCQYGQHQKDVLKCHYDQYLRPAARAPAPAPAPAFAGRRYTVGEEVDVFSKGEGNWVPAKVIGVADDGTVTVKWGRAQKEINACFLEEYLRPSAPIGLERIQPQPPQPMVQPTTMAAPPPISGCPYVVGQPIEVWTSSGGGWIEAVVQAVEPDGTVCVKWGVHMKRIPKHDYQGYLRPIAADGRNVTTEHMMQAQRSSSMANVTTSHGQLPPTMNSGTPQPGPLPTGNSMNLGVPGSNHSQIPPTIPGGYGGGGMPAMPPNLTSSPTMVHADQSSFNFQVPPTAFGSQFSQQSFPKDDFAIAPTNLGTGGPFNSVGSGGVRYHDVPTIPGGYA